MRKLLLLIGLITSVLTSVKAQVYSDVVYNFTSCPGGGACTGFVQNAPNVADSSQANYATMFNGLGVGSAVVLEYGFSAPAQAGALVGVTLQKGNQTLSAGLLSNITVQLISSTGTVVAQNNGLQLEDLGLLGGTGNTPSYVVTFYTPQGTYDIQRVRITLGGTANVLNDIRVYNAFYLSPATNGSGQVCGLEYATVLENSGCSGLLCSVANPGRAVDTLNYDDFATLNIPVGLLGFLGTADIEVSWDTPGDSSQYVGFIVGGNNTLLNLALISNLSIQLLDSTGNVVYNQAGFSTVDLSLLSGSSAKSIIGFYAPTNFASARIRLTQIVGLLTSLRVYGAIKFDATPDIVQIDTTPFTNLCSGDSVILTATPGYDQYFWSTGETTPSIVVDQTGTYSLTALDADACLYYSEVQPITINPLPPTPVIANIVANPTVLCNGDSVAVSVISAFPHVWSTGQADSSITLINSGVYYATVTDTLGCQSTSDTLTIIAETATVSIVSMDSTTCDGTSITLIASGNNPVSWNTGLLSDTLSITPAVNGTVYTAYVQSPNGCQDSASVTVQVNPLPPQPTIAGLPSDTVVICNGATQTFTITPSSGTYTPTWSTGISGNSIDVSTAGDYYVTIMDSVGCSRTSDTLSILTETATISINSSTGDSTACFSNTNQVTLIATANGSVLWSTSDTTTTIMVTPTATADYSATVTSLLGCTAVDTFTLTVNPLPTTPVIDGITPPGADSLILCNGASATFSVNVLFATTTWSTGDTTSSINVATAGDYFVTIQDLNGCEATSDTVSVFAETAQVDLFSADTAACAGDPITVIVTANGTVVWQDGSTGTAYFDNPSTTTTYTATVTTPLNCQDQITVTVTVSDTSAYATAQNDNGATLSNIQAPSVDISANDVFTGTATYSITSGPFNGTANINGSTVTYTPAEDYVGLDSLIYVICGANSCGTSCDTAVIVYTITQDPNPPTPGVKIPGGISPNGDGTNDTWIIDGLEDFPNNKLTILNRWGDILYKAEPYANNWNGVASQGLVLSTSPLPDGTYYYVLILGDGSKPIRGFIEIRK